MSNGRIPPPFELADHLLEVLDQASKDLGTEPSVILSQAMFEWACQHGYLSPGAVARAQGMSRGGSGSVKAVPSAPRAGRLSTATSRDGLPPPLPPSAASLGDENELPTSAGLPQLDEAAAAEALSPVIDLKADRIKRTIIGRPDKRLFVLVEGRAPVEVTKEEFLIGREPECELPLISSRISRRHARIVRGSASVTVEDLGSSNGTWFDGERITKRGIEHGDEVTMGDFILRFEYR